MKLELKVKKVFAFISQLLSHSVLQQRLQGQCVQTLRSSQHPPQAACLIG